MANTIREETSLPSSATSQHKTFYRPDIDGLRAIAVLAVVTYHLHIGPAKGGFVGVDVFFVISGYLITSIILKDLEKSSLSITKFYIKRIRRIVPALAAILLVCAGLGYAELLPVELKDFGNSLIAAALSCSNFYFWAKSGYFDAAANTKPLLHTWSLAVEEQFYLIFPVLLSFLWRRARQKITIILAVGFLGSFAISAFGAFHKDTWAFFLPHSRAWELLTGSFLALKVVPRLATPTARNVASLFGLGLITFAVLAYSPRTNFPGVAALAPCIGAALIIAAGESGPSVVGKLLSLPPITFIGLISYSVYLWHWPLLVFQETGGVFFSGTSEKTAKYLLLLTVLFAGAISWRFIERPFRSPTEPLFNINQFRFAAVCASIAIALGLTLVLMDGLGSRFPPQAVRISSYLEHKDLKEYRIGQCFLTSQYAASDYQPSVCLKIDEHKPNYLLIGDSYAAQLWHGFDAALPGLNIMEAAASGCRPTLERGRTDEKRCSELINFIYDDYLRQHHVDRILLAGQWQREDLPRIGRSLQWMKQHNQDVLLFGPMVQYDSALPRLLANSIRHQNPQEPHNHLIKDAISLDVEMMRLASSEWHVRYVSFYSYLCPDGKCLQYAGVDIPLQSDGAHFTLPGSLLFANRLTSAGILP